MSIDFAISCPNCGYKKAPVYQEIKPFPYTTTHCPMCGFIAETASTYLDLRALNELREKWNEDYELKGEERLMPLDKIPEQDQSLIYRLGENFYGKKTAEDTECDDKRSGGIQPKAKKTD